MDQYEDLNEEYRRAFVEAAAEAEADSGRRTKAVAVTLGEEDKTPEKTPGSAAESLQQWEAELAGRAEALQAAEALLTEKAAQIVQWMDRLEATQRESSAAGGMDLIETLQGAAFELAQDRTRLNEVLSRLVQMLGHEDVVALMALTSPMIERLAGSYVDDVYQRMDALAGNVRDVFSRNHLEAIADVHEDFEAIAGSEDFLDWLLSLPREEQARALHVVEDGSAAQVVKLLQTYKEAMKAQQGPSVADRWAADAAASVKGSAPLRLPSRSPRAPLSARDEFQRAWEAL